MEKSKNEFFVNLCDPLWPLRLVFSLGESCQAIKAF